MIAFRPVQFVSHIFNMKALGAIFAVTLAVGYPLLVFFGLQHYGPRGLAVVLLLFVGIRYFLVRPVTPLQNMSAVIVGLFCLCIIALDSQILLKLYPVVLSVGVAAIFFFSLQGEKTAIERFAELAGETITPQAKLYMRRLTACWGGLMLVNAGIAAYTAFYLSLSQWTFYNGFLSYLIIGIFMLAEWLYRQHYKKSRGIVS